MTTTPDTSWMTCPDCEDYDGDIIPCPRHRKPTTQAIEISAADLQSGVHGHRFTNLGAGFHLDIGGATQLTIHRWGQGNHRDDRDEQPVIDWINTYGNVTANRGRYTFSPTGAKAADMILTRIENQHAAKSTK